MKKAGIALAVLVSLGLIASQAQTARGGSYWGCGMWGPSPGYSADVAQDPAYQQFLDETAQLRTDLAGKQAAYRALMAQADPDEKKAGSMAREIQELREQLRAKAQTSGLGPPGPYTRHHRRHMGPGCYWGCPW
jgi:zinc resistance-associated protein